jgi:N-acyl-D-aspartate/D-glutamate deacylase
MNIVAATTVCHGVIDQVSRAGCMAVTFDLIIRNVRILDGSGEPEFHADIAIHEGKIAALGVLENQMAVTTLYGEGLVLAPGFIDVHTHDDLEVLRAPEMLPRSLLATAVLAPAR